MKVLCMFLLSIGCLPVATAAVPTKQTIDIAAFVSQLDTLRKEKNIPGLSVAVIRDQQVVMALGLGFADHANQRLATAQTAYDIASVSKPISALVALQLSEQGKLDLDEPMHQYSDWQDFCVEFSQQPTIFAKDLQCELKTHTLRHLLTHTASAKPGTRFSYNPILYSWASRPIMAKADKQFSTLVQHQIFDPVGMPHSARSYRDLPLSQNVKQQLAISYRIDDKGQAVPAQNSGSQGDGAAGGVTSTVLDLARFDIAFDSGQLINADSRQKMFSSFGYNNANDNKSGENTQGIPYGLGWFVQDYNNTKLVWHSGWWEDAWSALYLKIPEHHLSLIILANSEGIWWNNPTDKAQVEHSEFAQLFFRHFLVQ